MRVLVLGLDNAGKTTLVAGLRGTQGEPVAPTVGLNIDTLEWEGERRGGEEKRRSVMMTFFFLC